MKDSEKAMRYLTEQNNPGGRVAYKTVCDEVLGGNESKFWNVLAYLKVSGLVTVRETDQRTLHTCFVALTDKGRANAQMTKERKAEARKNRLINTAVAVVTALVTHVLTKFLS